MTQTVDVFDYLSNIAQIVRKCPTQTLRHAYVRAMRNWCRQTQWLRANIAGPTVPDVQQYELGNDPQLDIVGIYGSIQGTWTPAGGNAQMWDLPPSDPATWDANVSTGQPLRYAYVPEAQFAVYPTPDDIYDLLITLILTPKEGAVNVPIAPLQKYSTVFEAGALGYLYEVPGMPWTNLQMSQVKLREFQAGVNNGKADAQRNYQTGAMRAKPRSLANFNNRGSVTLYLGY
jgi:hypothetical protein